MSAKRNIPTALPNADVPEQKRPDKVTIANVATLDAQNPIPLEHFGKYNFLYRANRRYIPFLEGKDNFFQLLLEAKLLSPTNLLCVSSKTKYCIGEGYYFKDVEEDPNFKDFAKSLNRKGQSLNDILKSIFDNLFSVGNAFVEVVRGKIGSTRFVRVYVNSFLDMRLAIPDDDDIVTHALKSKYFRRQGVVTLKNEDAVEIPLWHGQGDQEWLDQDGNSHVVFHLKNEVSGYDYYGMPVNVACLPQQILEYKAARSNLDNFDNGLAIGGLVILQGNVTQDEAQALGREIVYAHKGDGNRGKYVIMASSSGIENSKILPFEKQKDGDYIEFDKRIEEKIISANEWDPYLAGIARTSGLSSGGATYIRTIFEIKNNTVIKPLQAYVIEKFVTPFLQIVDEWMGTRHSDHEFGINTVVPVSLVGDLDVNAILTKDEGREAMGYPAIDGDAGNEWIKSGQNVGLTDVQNQLPK